MDFIRFFLILIVPGFIAAKSYCLIVHGKHENIVVNALIFDLLIFIINITGLFYFKGITTMCKLIKYFECLSFTGKYALLSILVGLILSVIIGCIYTIRKNYCKRHCHKAYEKQYKKQYKKPYEKHFEEPFEESFENELMDPEKIKEKFSKK